jgi:2-amino-4-hydroxy-6-hydroxymethyldihydropteridine diphosphokinase
VTNLAQSSLAWIGLGSNLENPVQQIVSAIDRLGAEQDIELINTSSLYKTAPIDADGDHYINAVVQIRTRLDPHALLLRLQKIENDAGRHRPYVNAPRSLDLDLLLYEQQTINLPDLQIPHPRMHERAFVLIPLAQISPLIQLPKRGKLSDWLIKNQTALNTQSVQKLPFIQPFQTSSK